MCIRVHSRFFTLLTKNYGSPLFLGVCCVLAILLLTLAVIQYRWAGRLAAADAEHTTAQLHAAAGLFARDFDLRLAQVYVALQTQAVLAGSRYPQFLITVKGFGYKMVV